MGGDINKVMKGAGVGAIVIVITMAPDESERYNAFLESVGYFQNKNEPDPLRLPEGLPTLVKTFPTVGRLVARHMLTLTDMDQRRQIKDSFLSMRTLVKGLAEAPAPPIPHTPATEASEGGEGEEKDEEEEGKGGEEGGEPGQAELGTSFKGIDIDFNSDLLAEVNRHIDEDDWDSESAVASYNSFLKAVGYHGTFPDAAKLIDGTEDVDALLDFLDAHELKIAPGLSVDYRPVRIWKEIIQKIRDGGIKVIQKVRNKLYPWDKTISKYEVKEEEGGGGGGGGEVSEEGVGHADEVKAGTDAAGGPDPSVDEIAPVVPEYKVDSEENKEEDVHLKQPHVSLEDINIEFENAELERVDKAVNTFDITSPEAVSSYNFFLKVIGYFKKEPNAIELPGGMRQVDSQIEFIQACKDSVAKRRPEASKPLNKLYSKLRAYLHTIKRAITPKIVGGGGKKGTVDNKPAPAEPRRKPSDAASSRPSSAYTDQFESYSSGEESSGSYHIEEEEEEEELKEEEEEEKSKEDIPIPPVTYPTDADVAKLIPEPATSSVSLEDINIEFENAELERVDKAVNTFDITSPEAVSSYNFFLKVIGYFKKEPNAIELPGGMRQVDSQIEFIQACKDSVAKRRPEASKPLNKLYSKLRAYLHTIKRAITPKIVGGGGKKGTVDNKPAPAEPRRKPSDAASSRPSSAYTDQFESYSSGEESSGSYRKA